ncbi:MAG: hypothetical protein LBK68_07420 [Candidatus Margulisbacteria bacterium]|nr:hypothetical protein [Candidatus Margulisiibacteriota bacterium]
MTNADNYTDTTDIDFTTGDYNIATGKSLSAEGMRNALHTKENVANKTDTIDSSNSSSIAQYPSVKAVYDSLNAKDNSALHKTGVETITGIKTFGTTDAAAEPLLGVAKTTDATDNGVKFATEAQVYAINSVKQDKLSDAQLALLNSLSTLGFFPKGTILTFSAAAWDAKDSAFKAIWKICNGQNGTPNLIDKFLRGGDYGDDRATGGTNSPVLSEANLPKLYGWWESIVHRNGIGDEGGHVKIAGQWMNVRSLDTAWYDDNIHVSNTLTGASYSFSYGADRPTALDNRPAFYTVIYIMKVV